MATLLSAITPLILGILLRKNAGYAAGAVLILSTMAPRAVVQSYLPDAIHSVGQLVAIGFLIARVFMFNPQARIGVRLLLPTFAMTAALVSSAWTTSQTGALSGLQVAIDSFGTFIVLVTALLITEAPSKEETHSFQFLIAIWAAVQSVLAIGQVSSGSPIIWEAARAATWWTQRTGNRAYGTFESPLDLSFFLALSLALVLFGPKSKFTILLSLLYLTGITMTGSRVGTVVALFIIASAFLSQSGIPTRKRVTYLLAASFAGVFLYGIGALSGIIFRFQNGANSNLARSNAIQYFQHIAENIPITGFGFGSNGDLRTLGMLDSSLENGFLSTSYDLGLPVAVIYFCSLIFFVIRPSSNLLTRALACTSIILLTSFNSVTTHACNSLIAFTMIVFAAFSIEGELDSASHSHHRSI